MWCKFDFMYNTIGCIVLELFFETYKSGENLQHVRPKYKQIVKLFKKRSIIKVTDMMIIKGIISAT